MKKRVVYRSLSIVMILTLLLGIATGVAFAEENGKSNVSKKAKSYDIAVVYDNSGSMYKKDDTHGKKTWCRAKYAMEIFASMLDYRNNDKLTIYPMWAVTTDGNTKSNNVKKGEHPLGEPFSVTKIEDVDKISNMYTPSPWRTPIKPVDDAANALQKSNATEKWLIVLTDGGFDEIDNAEALQTKLGNIAGKNNIKVQYLGIDDAVNLKADEDHGFYAKRSEDKNLQRDLVDICNVIFERSVLPSEKLDSKKLTVDLSMNYLIVFAIGKGAKINSLTDSQGNKVNVIQDSKQRTYSKISAGDSHEIAEVDNTLAGHVVIFDAAKVGTYDLDYTDAESVQVFYEPNVDIAITLLDNAGDEVTKEELEKGIGEGTYTLKYAIVDSNTGEDVTESELLGKVELQGTVLDKNTGEERTIANGETIDLQAESDIEIQVDGTYLEDYSITTRDDGTGLNNNLNIHIRDGIRVDVEPQQSSYSIMEHDSWNPIKVHVEKNGKKLTDDELAKVDLDIRITQDSENPKSVEYTYKPINGESAFEVSIGKDSEGKYVEPECGDYIIKATATIKDKYGVDVSGKGSGEIKITLLPEWVWWIIDLTILGLILAILAFILTRKVLPKGVSCNIYEASVTLNGGAVPTTIRGVEYSRSGLFKNKGTLAIDMNYIWVAPGVQGKCAVTFDVEAVDMLYRYLFSSRRRRIKLTFASNECDEINTTGGNFVKDPATGDMIPDSENIVIGNGLISLNKKYDAAGIVCYLSLDCQIVRE